MLHHTRIAKSKRSQGLSSYRILLPEILQQTIIELYHDCLLIGQLGIKDTIGRLREHYFLTD